MFYDNHSHFIYTINNNSSIVYVGMTVQPSWRYKNHHYDMSSRVWRLGRYMLSIERPLSLIIIDMVSNRAEAFKVEKKYIQSIRNKYWLLNDNECSRPINSLLPRFDSILNPHLLYPEICRIKENEEKWSI